MISIDRAEERCSANSHTAADLDLISVCALGSPQWPHATAGLSFDGRILLCRDTLREAAWVVTFEMIQEGVAYSILSAQGHLFILTSEALFALPGFVARFLETGKPGPSSVVRLPMSCSDVFLANDREVIWQEEDTAKRLLIEAVVAGVPSFDGGGALAGSVGDFQVPEFATSSPLIQGLDLVFSSVP